MTNSIVQIIALVGMPGAGKSLAADFFRTKGVPIIRFGDQTDKEVKKRGLELTPENERKVREEFRKDLGMAAYAIKTEPDITEAAKDNSRIVLDGLYSWEEYTYLIAKFPSLRLLCIYARPAIRYERLSKRVIRPILLEKARLRDIAELENLNKGGPIAIADDLIINNTSNTQEFITSLESYYTSLL